MRGRPPRAPGPSPRAESHASVRVPAQWQTEYYANQGPGLDGAFVRLLQVLVEDDRIMRGSVRIEGIPRDRPRGCPSTIPIQAPRRISPLRVQCQETEPGAPRRVLDGLHQLSAQSHSAAAAMDQQLRNLRAMRLVRCPGRVELDGTNDSFDIAGYEEDCTGVGRRKGPSPP